MAKEQTIVIFRQKNETSNPYYERFTIPISPGMTILDGLFYIQDHFDSKLAFRYSCRGAICGSCGMTINKYPRLACKTQISTIDQQKVPNLPELVFGELNDWDRATEILIEPLPNMSILKDLVVDMEPFWKFYREVKPYFIRKWTDIKPESFQDPTDARSIEHLVYCILCGICWTCPVSNKNPNYFGPAALTKAYRFIADTRLSQEHRRQVLSAVNSQNGVPACEKLFVCNRVCPKGVQPGNAIQMTRKKLKT